MSAEEAKGPVEPDKPQDQTFLVSPLTNASGRCIEPDEQQIAVAELASDHYSQPMRSLAPEFVQVERLSNLIGSFVFAFPMSIGLIVLWFTLGTGWIFWCSLCLYLMLLLLFSFSFLSWPTIAYRNASWRLTDGYLEIHRGVFWKHRISIPLGRVQHADVSQGPLLRNFGLGKLAIHTAGTSNATIELNGLTHHDAIVLRDKLVQQTQAKSIL